MKLVLVGHACWLLETADVRILFDPLLFDPNQADCYEVHPSRSVNIDALRDVQVVVVSHRHSDHFDLRSLAALSREAQVLCPQDTLLADTLRRLGFRSVRALGDWQPVRFGRTSLLATPSDNKVPELGFVVSDSVNAVWNQVDTQVSARTAQRVNAIHGRLDVVISPWQPLMELKFQLNEETGFPHRDYFDLLARARSSNARMLVPGACGFRYTSGGDWMNRQAFPVARDRFMDDLAAAWPHAPVQLEGMAPGDEIVFEGEEPVIRRQGSPIASSSSDDEDQRVAYCPVDPFASLYRNIRERDARACGIEDVIEDLDRFVRANWEDKSSALQRLRGWKVLYQLIVCFDDFNCFVHWDLGRTGERVDGNDTRATMTSIVSGRVLRLLFEGRCGWEEAYHSGECRSFQTVAAVSEREYAFPRPGDVEDLLRLRYPYFDCFEKVIDQEIAQWGAD
ncbi:MBL fold metallo-hydrolase [Variovorax sp. dw_308]|uniref:MBL fold metallo-hydrolase n=1 Tax=Variovorax sp. dw_308 TaxID=2721546 RepID=UPI001C465715|nr:MBL fold metallo-hydrolase [Variovorax sp. dw_308]